MAHVSYDEQCVTKTGTSNSSVAVHRIMLRLRSPARIRAFQKQRGQRSLPRRHGTAHTAEVRARCVLASFVTVTVQAPAFEINPAESGPSIMAGCYPAPMSAA
jgi:hypothetical protein